jgi:hypothetical protein
MAGLSEVEESGCVLIRPDAHVAWRQRAVAEDCVAELGEVMDRVLGFVLPPPVESAQGEETARL